MQMKFNERLLRGIHPGLRALSKVYLFCIHEDIDLVEILEDSEEQRAKLSQVINALLGNGAIDVSIAMIEDSDPVSQASIRLRNIYVYPTELITFDVDKFRVFFSMNYLGIPNRMGDKGAVIERLEKFIAEENYTFDQICYAAKNFVDYHIAENMEEMVPKADKFIYDAEGKSRLMEHIENISLKPNE